MLFYFVIYVNIWIVKRLARDLEVGMAQGGTEQRVIFTRSYCAVILLNSSKFVQASSRVACRSLRYFLKSYRE